MPSKFKRFHIIAHSAGGGCLSSIQRNKDFKEFFYSRVEKIALTDSWAISRDELDRPQKHWMLERAIHYVASSKPVGELLNDNYKIKVCKEVSAGHPKHEYTTGYAQEEICKHFGYASSIPSPP